MKSNFTWKDKIQLHTGDLSWKTIYFSYGCKTLPINTIIFMLLCLDYVVNKTIIYNHVKVGFPAIRGIHS